MSKVKPVDALPPRRFGASGVDWETICAEVEAEGGRWCEVGVFTPSAATHMRQGRYPAVDPTKFEITTQKDPDHPGKSTFFMRLRT